MPGQDLATIPVTDTLDTLSAIIPLPLFDISTVVQGVTSPDGATAWISKVPMGNPTWLFVYLFVLLGFFAWIRIYYGNILTQTLQASSNFQVASRMFKDNSLLQNQLDNILYALYFLSIAFLLYLVEEGLSRTPYGLKGGLLYLFNLGLLCGVFFGRIVLLNLTGFLFNRLRIFREYLYNAFIFNKLMGMALLPLLLFVVYTTGFIQVVFFWTALATVAVVLLLRIIRGVVFTFKKEVSIFYMFLYLCALEIVPLALLYKWLEGIL